MAKEISNMPELIAALKNNESKLFLTGDISRQVNNLIENERIYEYPYLGITPITVLFLGYIMPIFSYFIKDMIDVLTRRKISRKQKQLEKKLRSYSYFNYQDGSSYLELKSISY